VNSSFAARYFPGILAKRSGNGAHSEDSNRVGSLTSESGTEQIIEAEDTDEVLILRLQKKDVGALGLLYRRYARLIYSVCARILRDSAEAEDLVHEVFLCLYRKCSSFDPAKGSARSWLLQLTYHKCFDWRDYLKARHGYGQGSGEEDVPAGRLQLTQDSDPADLIVWTPRMKAAFRSLSKEEQLTLKLYYFKGCTFQEVAEELGYSYGNVKNHFYRGMDRLRRIVFDGVTQRSSRGAGQRMPCEAKEISR
jgi:RNA polymerase sigma-70 factor (ECF subfamily)